MQMIGAGEFKARCLALMDEVERKREPLTITKKGRPVARLVPVDEEGESIFGFYAGKLTILGKIDEPVIPAESWKRLK